MGTHFGSPFWSCGGLELVSEALEMHPHEFLGDSRPGQEILSPEVRKTSAAAHAQTWHLLFGQPVWVPVVQMCSATEVGPPSGTGSDMGD